jgi:hypothetical protein
MDTNATIIHNWEGAPPVDKLVARPDCNRISLPRYS